MMCSLRIDAFIAMVRGEFSRTRLARRFATAD
jgi:hypothetical protein